MEDSTNIFGKQMASQFAYFFIDVHLKMWDF